MFKKVDSIIKGFAKGIFVLGVLSSMFAGVAVIVNHDLMYLFWNGGSGAHVIVGILIIIIGSMIACFNSCLLYGFGKIVENSKKTEQWTRTTAKYIKAMASEDDGDTYEKQKKKEDNRQTTSEILFPPVENSGRRRRMN